MSFGRDPHGNEKFGLTTPRDTRVPELNRDQRGILATLCTRTIGACPDPEVCGWGLEEIKLPQYLGLDFKRTTPNQRANEIFPRAMLWTAHQRRFALNNGSVVDVCGYRMWSHMFKDSRIGCGPNCKKYHRDYQEYSEGELERAYEAFCMIFIIADYKKYEWTSDGGRLGPVAVQSKGLSSQEIYGAGSGSYSSGGGTSSGQGGGVRGGGYDDSRRHSGGGGPPQGHKPPYSSQTGRQSTNEKRATRAHMWKIGHVQPGQGQRSRSRSHSHDSRDRWATSTPPKNVNTPNTGKAGGTGMPSERKIDTPIAGKAEAAIESSLQDLEAEMAATEASERELKDKKDRLQKKMSNLTMERAAKVEAEDAQRRKDAAEKERALSLEAQLKNMQAEAPTVAFEKMQRLSLFEPSLAYSYRSWPRDIVTDRFGLGVNLGFIPEQVGHATVGIENEPLSGKVVVDRAKAHLIKHGMWYCTGCGKDLERPGISACWCRICLVAPFCEEECKEKYMIGHQLSCHYHAGYTSALAAIQGTQYSAGKSYHHKPTVHSRDNYHRFTPNVEDRFVVDWVERRQQQYRRELHGQEKYADNSKRGKELGAQSSISEAIRRDRLAHAYSDNMRPEKMIGAKDGDGLVRQGRMFALYSTNVSNERMASMSSAGTTTRFIGTDCGNVMCPRTDKDIIKRNRQSQYLVKFETPLYDQVATNVNDLKDVQVTCFDQVGTVRHCPIRIDDSKESSAPVAKPAAKKPASRGLVQKQAAAKAKEATTAKVKEATTAKTKEAAAKAGGAAAKAKATTKVKRKAPDAGLAAPGQHKVAKTGTAAKVGTAAAGSRTPDVEMAAAVAAEDGEPATDVAMQPVDSEAAEEKDLAKFEEVQKALEAVEKDLQNEADKP
jgi:hypothetical protein